MRTLMDENGDLVRRVMDVLNAPAPVVEAERTTILFGFRLQSAEGPIQSCGVRCLHPENLATLAGVPNYPTNERGEGVICWHHRHGRPPSSMLLEVRLGGDAAWTRLCEISLHPVMQFSEAVQGGLTLHVYTDVVGTLEAEPGAFAKPRRVRVALAGTSQELTAVLPALEHRSCLSLCALFVVSGGIIPLTTGQTASVIRLSDCEAQHLEDVDVLIDFTNDGAATALANRMSQPYGPPIVLDGRLFFRHDGSVNQSVLDWLGVGESGGAADALE